MPPLRKISIITYIARFSFTISVFDSVVVLCLGRVRLDASDPDCQALCRVLGGQNLFSIYSCAKRG
jgi:hypothetical protein